jgi:hypothetical protein
LVLLVAVLPHPGLRAADATDPDLVKAALDAPAVDVARDLCSARQALKMAKFAEGMGSNVTIVVGGIEVSGKNANQVRDDMGRQIAASEAAARQRGVASVAPRLRATAENCDRSGSFVAAAINEGVRDVVATQKGPAVVLSFRGKVGGKKQTLDAEACLVEDRLAMIDPVETGFSYLGQATEGRLVIRPDVEALLSGMFPPADRATLEACVITLDPATPQ